MNDETTTRREAARCQRGGRDSRSGLGGIVSRIPRRAFHLDDEEAIGRNGVERLLERWDAERPDLFGGKIPDQSLPCGRPSNVGIVQQDRNSVGCETDVDLHAVGSRIEPRTDRGERVLGAERRSPAVPDHLHRDDPVGAFIMSHMLHLL